MTVKGLFGCRSAVVSAIFLLCLSYAVADNVTYHIQRIYLDRESTYNVAVLRFQHDALANLPSTDYYVADSSVTLCGQSRCLPLSTYTLNTQGIAKLNCPLYVGNDTTSTQSVTLSNGPLSNTISPSELSHKLFFVPPEQYDPLGTYFKVMSGFTIPPASTSFSNQLALVFLAQPDLWDLNTHTLQFDGNRIHLDECTLAIEYNGQSTNYGLNLAERTCDFNRFQLLELQVKTEVATITDIRNYDLLFAKSNEVMMLLSQKIWSDCALMFEELTAIYQNPAVTLEVLDSTTCIHRFGSREYAVDPCCNQTLLYDQCCSVRNYSFIFPQYLTANFSGLNSICPSRNLASLRPEQVHWTFLDSIFQRFRAENPAEGCLVMNEVNERSLNALNSLYRTCHLHIYGERNSGYPCKTDADCLTSCNLVSRTCVIPWADPLGAFVKCFNSSFSPVVKKYVRLAVDPDSNNSNLEDETLHQMLNNLTMTTYDCVGPLADAVRANNSGNINEPLCLDPKACNWRECDGLTQAECSQVCLEKSQYLCGECWEDGTCRDYSETKGCFAATTETAATCETLGGTWVPYERVCRLPQYMNKDECLVGKICADLTMRNEGVNWNRTICPALCYDTKLDINTCKDQDCDNPCCDPNQGCADKTVVDCMCAYDSYCCDKWDSYCARRAIDFKCAKCDCIRRKWHPNSAGGFCESFATSNDCEDVIVNATWWSGRTWRHGRFDNPERCSQGACNIGVQLEPSDCAVTYGCDVPCFQCESNLNEPIELCTSNVPAASCPGYMDAEFNRCTYPNVTRANCTTEHVCATFTHPGVTNCLTEVQVQSISCADLSLQDCQRCQAGLTTCPYNQTNFQCRVASRQCANETECATTGYCEDAEMIPEVGLCVDSFIINVRNGDAMCREGQTMFRIGCVVPNVTDPINCTAVRDHNGVAYPRWIERSRTQALCASSSTMCLEDEFDVNTDQYIQRRSEKPPAECLACGGRVENVYNWIPGSWKPGVMNPLDWAPRFYGSVNKWIKSVNFTKLQDILDNAITHKTAIQIKSEYLCRFDYLFGFVDHFMCYCGDADCDYGNKEFWYTTSVNMVHVFNNFTKSASAGFATVYFDNSTRILVDNFVATFKTIPATSFVGAENQLSLADRFDDGRNRILIENIVMWEGFEVGILIGDGIEVDFGNNTSAVLDMETGYYVCFERRPEYNISFDDLYPHPDIGEVIYDERWKVHVQPLELEQLDVTSEHICARIKKDGVFVPIMRSELIRDSYWNNMFLWIAIGAYGFMALFAIVMLIVVWTVKNSKSKFMYGYRKWKTLVICTVIFIAIIRGVHLFLIMHLHFLRMNPVHDYILGWYLIEQAPLALMVSAISLLMWTVIHYNGQAIVRYKHRGWFTQGCFVLLFRRNLVHIIINIANLLFYAAILILIEYLRDSRALWDQISKITVTGAMVILAFFTLGAEIANRSAKLIVMMSFLCLAVLAHGAHVCLLNFFGLYFGDPFAWLSLVIYFSAEVVVGCMVCLRTILSPGFKMGGIVPYEIDYSPVSAQKEPEEYEEEDYPPDYDPDAPPDYDPDGPPRPNRPLPYPPVPARTRTRKLPYPPVPPRYKPPEPPVSKSLESAVELEDVTEQELENEYVPPQVHLEEEIEEEEESESEPEPKDDKKRLIPKVQRKGNYGYIRDHRPSYGRSAIPEGVNEGQKDEYSRSLEKSDQIRRPSYGVSQVPKGKVDNLSKSLFINTDALKPPKK